MKSFVSSKNLSIVAVLLSAVVIWMAAARFNSQGPPDKRTSTAMPVAVEVSDIVHGPMEQRRTFSGALAPHAEFVISPKVSGRVERLFANLGDVVEKGQVIAELDNDEYVQAVAQAHADLLVAKANLMEAENALEIAARELNRFETLRTRGVASDSQLDAARADQLSKQARREVARAQVTRSEAMLEAVKIRLGYTKITAEWTDGNGSRVVAERFVDEGDMVAANDPILSIVALDPMIGIIFVSEKDYVGLHSDQAAYLTTDAFADKRFDGKIQRIAPVFGSDTRQARIELTIDNPGHLLKPGMFIRATVVLDQVADAVMVPEAALTSRDDQPGVFVVSADGRTVSFQPVRTGIREDNRVQLIGDEISGLVVVLGHQLLNDGAAITIPDGLEMKDPQSGGREMESP